MSYLLSVSLTAFNRRLEGHLNYGGTDPDLCYTFGGLSLQIKWFPQQEVMIVTAIPIAMVVGTLVPVFTSQFKCI